MTAHLPTQTSGSDGLGGEGADTPRRHASRALLVIGSIVVIMVGAFSYLAIHQNQLLPRNMAAATAPVRATGIPASVPTSLAYLMGLSTVPIRTAPNFTLTDQHGNAVSLAALRGRAIVLEFMDPNCVDICPIVSQEFVDAYHDLGPAASRVVFLAVNVNQYHVDVASMAAYSRAHNLDTLPSWHFLTGEVGSLQRVWRDYNVEVSAPSPTADVVHTSVAYFIDPNGRERYVAFPMVDHTATGTAYLAAGPLAAWGHGIALIAQSLS